MASRVFSRPVKPSEGSYVSAAKSTSTSSSVPKTRAGPTPTSPAGLPPASISSGVVLNGSVCEFAKRWPASCATMLPTPGPDEAQERRGARRRVVEPEQCVSAGSRAAEEVEQHDGRLGRVEVPHVDRLGDAEHVET